MFVCAWHELGQSGGFNERLAAHTRHPHGIPGVVAAPHCTGGMFGVAGVVIPRGRPLVHDAAGGGLARDSPRRCVLDVCVLGVHLQRVAYLRQILLEGLVGSEAMVIAIERNHWPLEWRYLIRLEQPGKPPQARTAILDRGLLNSTAYQMTSMASDRKNPSDDLYYIRPEEATFQDNDVAFFFNAFEQALQVTIIQKVEPSSHETVRMTQPSSRNRSPSMTHTHTHTTCSHTHLMHSLLYQRLLFLGQQESALRKQSLKRMLCVHVCVVCRHIAQLPIDESATVTLQQHSIPRSADAPTSLCT